MRGKLRREYLGRDKFILYNDGKSITSSLSQQSNFAPRRHHIFMIGCNTFTKDNSGLLFSLLQADKNIWSHFQENYIRII